MEEGSEKINRTTKYILPLLIEANEYKYIEQAYLGINNIEDENRYIYLKVKKENIQYISKKIVNKDNYIGKTIIKDFVIYILQIPFEFEKDYDNFVIGNYTGLDIDSKRKIMRFWSIINGEIMEQVWKVMYANIEENFMIEKAEELTVDEQKIKFDELLEAIKQVGEIDSIPKVTDEILIINN